MLQCISVEFMKLVEGAKRMERAELVDLAKYDVLITSSPR
jgi:hypothetical protein